MGSWRNRVATVKRPTVLDSTVHLCRGLSETVPMRADPVTQEAGTDPGYNSTYDLKGS